ncbi:MAG: S1C family serine protease [Lachnospira sp.]
MYNEEGNFSQQFMSNDNQQTSAAYTDYNNSGNEQAGCNINYSYAQVTNDSDNNRNNNNNKKNKKSRGVISKILCTVALGLLFGAVAGGTMLGINYAYDKLNPEEEEKNYDIQSVSETMDNLNSFINSANVDGTVYMTETINAQAIAAAALPAMVEIKGTVTVSNSYYPGFGQSYESGVSGTGIIVGKSDTELLVLTNAHVVEDVNNLSCVFIDGESVNGVVKGSKSDKDIAVVAVSLNDIPSSTFSEIAIAELADSDVYSVGEQVVVIGNALGNGQSVTQGIISAVDRSITVDDILFEGLIMTDAAINSGNSGGAMINAQGKVIGINFAKTSSTGVEGMGYTIPVSNVRDIIDSLMNKETRVKVSEEKRGYLGVSGLDITSTYSKMYNYPVGVLIRTVQENSAADIAGLEQYDIIVSIDDEDIKSFDELSTLLQYYESGEKIQLGYYHLENGEYNLKTVEVTLGSRTS